MKRLMRSSEKILAMSNVRGIHVKNPGELDFSFYFSSGAGVDHGPRVKPMFKNNKLISSLTGTLKLCDDWEYLPGSDDTHVDSQSISKMKKFFKSYIVLFCAVWDEQMQDAVLEDWFKGSITFNEMLEDLDFYEDYKQELDNIHDVKSLEKFCRDNELVNFYGN